MLLAKRMGADEENMTDKRWKKRKATEIGKENFISDSHIYTEKQTDALKTHKHFEGVFCFIVLLVYLPSLLCEMAKAIDSSNSNF